MPKSIDTLGRPKLGVDSVETATICLVMPTSLLNNEVILDLRKKRELSKVIRKLLEKYLASKRPTE